MSLAGDESVERRFSYERISGAFVPVGAVILAMIVGGFVVRFAGNDPWSAYSQLFQGAFGGPYNVSETLLASIPLMLAGLSVAFAFRAGLFNIGAEGQLLVGAIASSYVGYKLNLPGLLLIPIALVVGALGGAIWGGIAGGLKAWRGAHEVITTIMLNYIAINISHYLLESAPSGEPGPMGQHIQIGNPETLPMNAHLPIISPNSLIPNGRLHAGLIVALIAAAAFSFLLWRTTFGYKLRAVGLSPKAAAYAGIPVGWNTMLAMVVSGAFAGLAGMVAIYGVAPYQLTDNFSPGYGFQAIAVALLGRNTAFGTIMAAILFGAFQHGGSLMQANANISTHLVDIIQGLIIYFIGAEYLVRYIGRLRALRPRQQGELAA